MIYKRMEGEEMDRQLKKTKGFQGVVLWCIVFERLLCCVLTFARKVLVLYTGLGLGGNRERFR